MTKRYWRQADITTPGGQHCPLHIHTKGMINTNPWEWRSPVSSRFNKSPVKKRTPARKTKRTSPRIAKRTYRRKPAKKPTRRSTRKYKNAASRNFYSR